LKWHEFSRPAPKTCIAPKKHISRNFAPNETSEYRNFHVEKRIAQGTIKTMQKLFLLLIFAAFSCSSMNASAERIEITLADSSTLALFRILPDAIPAEGAPLVILMPGGSGDEALARDLHFWLGEELAQRGWAVAVPVSPNGRSFRGANNALIPLLIEKLQEDPLISDGKVLLAGISNGGMSALEVASLSPERYLGIMAVPALVPERLNVAALDGMPIYLRIGDQDEMNWMNRFEETRAALESAGAVVDAGLVFMAPHMFSMEWETLDPWLITLLQSH
jgi:pimeloyl-ACP methyl ester carboxylesterase